MSNELQRSDKGFMGMLKTITMTNADRINAINRNVVEYKPCNMDAFFEPKHGVYNALVSGGDPRLRTSAMVSQAICAFKNGFPVIVLHGGNKQLEQQLRSSFSSTGRYKEISSSNPCFEPFYGLTELELCNQIIETVPKDYDMKFDARYYVDGISEFLRVRNRNPSFKMFSTCPHSMILDKVDELKMQGKISDYQAQEIKSKLMMGQSENYKLGTYFANLKMEMEPLMYVSKRGQRPTNVITALKSGSVLNLNLSSAANKILLNTIIYQLKLALSKGMQYQIIIDSIPINSNGLYASYIQTPSDKVCRTIATDDFYAMVDCDENVFSSVAGNSQIIVVMNHLSRHGAMKWAEVFGQYEKVEKAYSTSCGGSMQNPFATILNLNYSRTVNLNKSQEYIVKPEAIMRLENGEAYILSAALGELAHLMLTG